MKTFLLLGPPGTGKTTHLLNIMDGKLKQGYRPDEIAFVAFTKSAAKEALTRGKKKFGFNQNELPHVRTIHSFCFREINATRNMMLDRKDFENISNTTGFQTTGIIDPEEGLPPESGDFLLSLINLGRSRCEPLEKVWEKSNADIPIDHLNYFNSMYMKYKNDFGKMDFTDQLENYLMYGEPVRCKIVIIDEGQDLSTLQWHVIKKAFNDAEQWYIAGDDDQAIYKWSGADVNYFLSMETDERKVLRQSWRLPAAPFAVAKKIANSIKHRYDKKFYPKMTIGKVERIISLDYIDFLPNESYFILVRNKKFFWDIRNQLEVKGVYYSVKGKAFVSSDDIDLIYTYEKFRKGMAISKTKYEQLFGHQCPTKKVLLRDLINAEKIVTTPWFDALKQIPLYKRNYYRVLLQNGYNLKEKPKVNLSTIHGVKGNEADNVILYPDMLYKSFEEYQNAPDNEHRVFYVGATRTRNNLFIVSPSTEMHYNI